MRFKIFLLIFSALGITPVLGADAPASGPVEAPSAYVENTKEFELSDDESDVGFTLFIPRGMATGMPAVIFLPGVMAEIDQYWSYANALAAQGILVAMHHWYSPLTSDVEIARDAKVMALWLTNTLKVDKGRLGIAGHSFGAKDAILAEGIYGGFAAIAAIDPDNSGDISAVDDYVPRLTSPLLLIGAEVAWQGPNLCAPMDANYIRFFEKAPAGTIELTLKDADHVQMLDDPERFGYTICRVGDAESKDAHDLALKATVAFFKQHLLGVGEMLDLLPAEHVRIVGKEPQKGSSALPAGQR
jgi:dienelactone hydrolase